MRIYIIMMLVLFTLPASATVVTIGNLTYNNAGNTIQDNNGYIYSSLNQTGLKYNELLTEIADVNSSWYGYSIATSDDADRFVDALLGGGSSCGATDTYGQVCGTVSNWNDGALGASYSPQYDYFSFVSTQATPNHQPLPIGLLGVRFDGTVIMYDDWTYVFEADNYASGRYTYKINYLLVRNTNIATNVPEPSAIALMGLGLLGFGVNRRKQKTN